MRRSAARNGTILVFAGAMMTSAAWAQPQDRERSPADRQTQTDLQVAHVRAADAYERLSDSVGELRNATLLLLRRERSPDRDKAIEAAQAALRAAQQAMLEMPPELRVEDRRIREAKDWPMAMSRLDEATQSLQSAVEGLRDLPDGERKDAAVGAVQDTLEETQRAMAAIPDWRPGSASMRDRDLRDDRRVSREREDRRSDERRGFIGVQLQSVSREIAEGFGLRSARGALVADVQQGSPAQRAGIRAGDIIIRADDELIGDPRDLSRFIASQRAESEIELTYVREGNSRRVSITIGERRSERPDMRDRDSAGPDEQQDAAPRLGLGLRSGRDGVSIAQVEPGSAAARSGLREGDQIIEVAGKQVSTPADVAQAVRDARRSDRRMILMRVRRDGSTQFFALPLQSS